MKTNSTDKIVVSIEVIPPGDWREHIPLLSLTGSKEAEVIAKIWYETAHEMLGKISRFGGAVVGNVPAVLKNMGVCLNPIAVRFTGESYGKDIALLLQFLARIKFSGFSNIIDYIFIPGVTVKVLPDDQCVWQGVVWKHFPPAYSAHQWQLFPTSLVNAMVLNSIYIYWELWGGNNSFLKDHRGLIKAITRHLITLGHDSKIALPHGREEKILGDWINFENSDSDGYGGWLNGEVLSALLGSIKMLTELKEDELTVEAQTAAGAAEQAIRDYFVGTNETATAPGCWIFGRHFSNRQEVIEKTFPKGPNGRLHKYDHHLWSLCTCSSIRHYASLNGMVLPEGWLEITRKTLEDFVSHQEHWDSLGMVTRGENQSSIASCEQLHIFMVCQALLGNSVAVKRCLDFFAHHTPDGVGYPMHIKTEGDHGDWIVARGYKMTADGDCIHISDEGNLYMETQFFLGIEFLLGIVYERGKASITPLFPAEYVLKSQVWPVSEDKSKVKRRIGEDTRRSR